MNRGNDRQSIFDGEEDYKLFMDKLVEFSESYKAIGVIVSSERQAFFLKFWQDSLLLPQKSNFF